MLKSQLEALLFSSGRAMQEEQLCQILSVQPRELKKTLEALKEEYANRETALQLFQEGSAWKMMVREEHVPLVRRIVADTELEKATLETLAVIAYQYPSIVQSKVVDMRGSNAYEHIKQLEELGFITRQKEGRSFKIKLNEKFFEYFDVEGGKIREVFGDVKVPEKVGSLDVVEVPTETPEESGKLGPLKVVETEPQEHDHEFLDSFEKKLVKVQERNDELEKDESFKPLEKEEEAPSEERDPELDGEGESEPEKEDDEF